MVKGQTGGSFQPNALVRAVFHNALAQRNDLIVVLLDIFLPIRNISSLISCHEQGIHQLVQQGIIVGVFPDALPGDRDAVINAAFADGLLKPLQIDCHSFLFGFGIQSHQMIHGHAKDTGDHRQQLQIGIASAGFPAGNRLVGDAQLLGKLFLGHILFPPKCFDFFTDF